MPICPLRARISFRPDLCRPLLSILHYQQFSFQLHQKNSLFRFYWIYHRIIFLSCFSNPITSYLIYRSRYFRCRRCSLLCLLCQRLLVRYANLLKGSSRWLPSLDIRALFWSPLIYQIDLSFTKDSYLPFPIDDYRHYCQTEVRDHRFNRI